MEYSKKVDAVIYKTCIGWSPDEFLDLAIAALDQWVKPTDDRGIAVIAQMQALKDSDEEDICGYCGELGADKMAIWTTGGWYWPGEKRPETEFVHASCENEETQRAHAALTDRQREDFLLSCDHVAVNY